MSDDPLISDEYINRDGFKPGTWGCHEALHMTAFLESAVENELVNHPSIRDNPEWYAEAHKILDGLRHLYQLIGNEHLSA